MEFALEVEVDNILTTRHHFFSRLVAKAHNALKHIFFVFQIFLIGEFQCLFKIIDTQHVVFGLNDLTSQSA